ncbi:hypothetical protein [Psychrobacter fulvigenes]|uniref:hypothetical protein n=1 Tax=Psychrobacter fulvigenes TaxID=533323 RepID=UPI001D122ECC|nr:hypothetical protein [Psychrobacter fulvigenes]
MRIYLGLLLALFSFSTSASSLSVSNTDTNHNQSNVPNRLISDQSSPRVSWGGADSLANASKATTRKMNIYKDQSGQVLLTNISPSGNFDKFTKKKKVVYRDIEKEREEKWERQLNEKPAARIGMSHKQVLSDTNWGKPKDVRTTIAASGTSEQWMYSSTHSLYFKGGKLIKIEK